MKNKMKLILGIMLSVSIFAVGCTTAKDDKKEQTSNIKNKEIVEEKGYSKELTKMFPLNEKKDLNYNGTLEYGETLKIFNISSDKKEMKIHIKGEVAKHSDEGEGFSNSEHQFEKIYTVKEDSVIEEQKTGKAKVKAIEKSTILKAPLDKGRTWTEKVSFMGKEYDGETKILNSYIDKDNKRIVETETTIKGVEGYPNKIYKEKKVFKEELGLVEFSNTILLDGKDTMEFNYRLNK
ncbi:hypothetical protein DP149_01280 [Clostridium tetani]|nr:hypothetical protein [Clostridium tetani]KGI40994.1 hypothetical protein KY52_02775 [Clostridium tetani]KGI46016.1 hypothetical protein KY54_02485 [Clostridium tetani]KHO36920.1 hypothetical protein OR63_03190 [Clostridium tetani]KIG20360.1 hypothetical protein RS78_09910 [Clostridium tetani]RXI58191.1 hypothetical protein DP125_11890 [Clostridium tetani]